jgi:hypothetical protein
VLQEAILKAHTKHFGSTGPKDIQNIRPCTSPMNGCCDPAGSTCFCGNGHFGFLLAMIAKQLQEKHIECIVLFNSEALAVLKRRHPHKLMHFKCL